MEETGKTCLALVALRKMKRFRTIMPNSNIKKSDSTLLAPITVIMSTRNRGTVVGEAVKSILNSDYPDFELRVIDQSDNDTTEKALAQFTADPHFHYQKTSSRGCSNGRNLGIRQAKTEYIALTDDDCVVPDNWLKEMVAAFENHPEAGVVLGNLLPGEYDPETSYLPTFVREQPYLLKSTNDEFKDKLGWGACMGIRQSAWKAVNGFDPVLGAGAPLKSAEDRDFSFRVLDKGYQIYFTPQVGVIHNGVRQKGKEGKELAYRDWYGAGAILAKHLKCRHWKIVGVEIQLWLDKALKVFLTNLFLKRRLGGVIPVISFWLGLASGLLAPLDYKSGNFAGKNF